MKCPLDDSVLQMSNRDGIEIDYCPSCRGVWLDRGELDKIIERNGTRESSRSPQANTQNSRPHRFDDDDYKYSQGSYGQHHKKSKKSFLGDIFDF